MSDGLYPLPDGWRWVELADVADIGAEQILPNRQPKKSFNYVALENIERGTGRLTDFAPTRGAQIGSNKYKFTTEHVLYGKLRPYLQKALVPDFDGISVTDLLPLKPNTEILDRYYLWRWLLSFDVLEYVTARQTGVKMPRLRSGDLETMPVPLPPLTEQQRIVEKIEKLLAESRTAREALEKVPPVLQRFRQSVLAKAFRGELTERQPGDEPAWMLLERIRAERRKKWEAGSSGMGKKYVEPEPLDTTNLPQLPEGWCWTSLEQLLARIDAGHSPNAQSRPANPGELGVLKVSAMSWGKFLPEENKALLPGTKLVSEIAVRSGDLLISRANTVSLVGAVVVVEQDYPNLMLSDKSLRLVPIMEAMPRKYLLYSLRTKWARDVFEKNATGTSDSMRNISQDTIKSAPIVLPPLAEQRRIVAKIESLFEQAEAIERAVEMARRRAEKVDQAVLARAFRGELCEA